MRKAIHSRANAPRSDRKVLVVEDSDDLREFMALAVEMLGHHAVQTSDHHAGMELLRSDNIDAVITDVMMNGEAGGLDLLSHVRSDMAPPVPPVIVCSGFPHFEDEARQLGAWAFLNKPFTLENLQEELKEALAGHPAKAEMMKRAATRSRKLRNRAAQEAEAGFREMRTIHPELIERAGWGARWASAYLGARHAMVLSLVDGDLRVAASSDETVLPVGAKVDDRLPFCRDVLETASSLMMPDASRYATVPARAKPLPLRSLAAVPLTSSNGVAIGAVYVFDERPAALDADDLAVVEMLGQRASAVMREEYVVPFFDSDWLVGRETFSELLGIELRRARRSAGYLEMAVVALGRRRHDSSWGEAMSRVANGRRRAVSALSPEQIGMYVAADDGATAAHDLGTALTDVGELLGIRGSGVVAVAGGQVPALGERALMSVADVLASRAQRGRIERVVLRAESWQPKEPRSAAHAGAG